MQQQGAQSTLIVVGDDQIETGDLRGGNYLGRICLVERDEFIRTGDGLVAQGVTVGESGLAIQIEQ
ncbi:hypothetical protein BB029_31175 [Pseudomonas sp. S3E12]|nr:hypothetical protein BB029_31175 [Pseudomonas sp. S3E12]